MSFRKWLLSSVVFSSFMGVAPGYGAASKPEILYPKSSWAVSKIKARQLGGGEYCALARRFDNSIILTFARNRNDESSVAIDFQKDTIDSRKTYDVTLDPGFGQARTYSIQPVSKKALVVRLGEDFAFYDALTRSGKLTIGLGNSAYQFGMPDMDTGQGQLNGCLVSLVEPAAGDFVPAVPVPDKGKSEPLLPDAPPVISSLASDEMLTLKEENARLRTALQQERRIFEDRFLKEAQDSSLISELNERIGLLETENRNLRGQVSDSLAVANACPAPDTSVQDGFRKEVDGLREENSQLKAEIHSLRYKVTSLGEAATKAKVETDQLLKQQVAAAEERAMQAEAGLAEAKERMAAIEKTARLADEERANLERQIVEAGQREALAAKRLAEARQEVAELTRRVERAEGVRTDVEADISAAEQRARLAEEQLAEARQRITDIGAQARAAEDARASLGQRVSEAEEKAALAEKQLADARQEIKELAALAGSAEAARTDIGAQVAAAEERAQRAEERFAEARRQIAEMEQQAKLSVNTHADGGRQLSDAEARARQAEQELVEAGQRIAVLEQRLESAQQNIESLRLESAQAQEKAEKAFLELAEANRKLEANAESVQIDTKSHAAIEDLLERIAVLEGENRDLKASLQAVTTANAAPAVTPLPGDDALLVTRLRALESELGTVKKERDLLAREISELRTASEDRLVQVSANSWDLEQATRRFNEAEREIRRLGMAIEKEQERCAKEKKEIEYMLFDPAIATKEQIARLHELETALAGRDAELATQKDKVASLENQLKMAGHYSAVPSVAVSRGGFDETLAREASELASISPAAGSPVSASASIAGMPAPVKAYELQDSGAIGALKAVDGDKTGGKVSFITKDSMDAIFRTAGVTIRNMSKVDAVSGQDLAAFSWETGEVFGSAEQKRLAGPGAFTDMARDYIARTQGRCTGEFAVVPVLSEEEAGRQLATYEIACIGNQGSHDASASLLFVSQNGLFTAIAHEAPVSSMDAAMDIRDRLAEAFRNKTLAASLH